jgi:hypothetical protein
MLLIELFSDYVRNKKSLKVYVEKRKSINERGEFNDKTLFDAQECLEKLQKEEPDIYILMYETLSEYYKQGEGHTIEYPINFIRQILQICRNNISAQKVYESYKKGLNHYYCDA